MSTFALSKRPALPGAKLRKPAQTVSTNLSHYDRLDPFAALNALRKLLSQLPAKLGGCQYKMTREEHKLSMHLLMIVEPFVGATPSRRNIACQPTEILDNIAFYVDSKRDLLSLALTCQRMYNVIFPRHFNYRVVRAKVSSIRVWNHLIVHRGLARHVRRLEILDERSPEFEIVPSGIITTDTDVESTDDELEIHAKQEKLLVSAIARMQSLQSLKWSCTHSLISIACLWPTLLKCPQLGLIDLNDNTMFLPSEDQDSSEEDGESSRVKEAPVVRLRSEAVTSYIDETPALGYDYRFPQVDQELLRHHEAPSASSHFWVARELS
jgi:hypothetical protein